MIMEIESIKGQAGIVLLVIFGIIIIVFLALPFINLSSFGIATSSNNYVGNTTQGVVVSSFKAPSSVAPLSSFTVTFYVSNNLKGYNANNIEFCLDNLGVLKLVSWPSSSESGSSLPGGCVLLGSLFPGETEPLNFIFDSPSNGAYENIPYTQQLGYYLNFSYSSIGTQPVEFVSQSRYGSGNYPAIGSFQQSAGPLQETISAQQPAIYGSDIDFAVSIQNTETGFTIGDVTLYIIMNSSIINITNPSVYGLSDNCVLPSNLEKEYVNDQVFCISQPMGLSGLQISFPVGLNPNELNSLENSNSAYLQTQFTTILTYNYEENGFFPISLQTESYYLR